MTARRPAPAPSRYFLVGLTGGDVGVHCEKWGCPWVRVLPPNSTVLDLERVMKTHTHPNDEARKADAA